MKTGIAGALAFGLAPSIASLSKTVGGFGFSKAGVPGALAGVVATKKLAHKGIDALASVAVDNASLGGPTSPFEQTSEERSLLAGGAEIVDQPSFRSYGSYASRNDPYHYYKEILESMKDITRGDK